VVSQTTRYALQILGFLVTRRDERTRGDEIARATGIPANYLSKIMNQLRKSGLVDSQKGWGGGFVLKQEAQHRRIGEVVAIFEGEATPPNLQACVFGLPQCDDANPCPLHPYWGKIRETYHQMLDEKTVGELRMRKRP